MRFLANRDQMRRFLAISVCLLIFLFVLQARLDLHGQGFVPQNHPHESHKARFEANSSKTVLPAITVCWFAAAITYVLLFRGQPLVPIVFSSLVAHDTAQRYHRQFLRPPPPLHS